MATEIIFPAKDLQEDCKDISIVQDVELDLHNRHVSSPVPVKEGHWVPPERLLKVALGHNSVTTEYL